MGKNFKHLTLEKRYEIHGYLQAGLSKRKTAIKVKVSHTTIINETKKYRTYNPQKAQKRAVAKRKNASSKVKKLSPKLTLLIIKLLKKGWSPEQIAGWLSKENNKCIISHESIYSLIREDRKKGGLLYKYLRRSGKKYSKEINYQAGVKYIPERVCITQRPSEVDQKTRIGDFEVDLLIGKNHKGAIISMIDRKTMLLRLALVKTKSAELVVQGIIGELMIFKNIIKTITMDNGREFARHQLIKKALSVDTYFARPYKSNDRALNENHNGLIRQYFPKKTDFSILNTEEIKEVELKLNSRPRKTLGYKTPVEYFLELTSKSSGKIQT